MTQAPARPIRPPTRGPVLLAFELVMGLVMVSLSSVVLGVVIEIVGTYTIWKTTDAQGDEQQSAQHARGIVEEDLAYIAAAPKSLLVRDTVAFSQRMTHWIALPYRRFGLLQWYSNVHSNASESAPAAPGQKSLTGSLRETSVDIGKVASTWMLMSMYVAMDVALRLSIALFALPAFVLACLLGAVDGLVRRDLRRWSGGRESSFVYHHAKRYTAWSLSGGFGLYLMWPFGGFNPAYMVLVFTVLVAATLSTTIAAFKKYV
ncbi:DUF4400 domain-containing protein [Diaphorobacter sp. HDW4A]|uniref:DUF4400 domain-containing protein n=1 Tax=Diaphorobacter sp. HDW4A TaxID=2714924 RepID=UPI001409C0C3|nr:DUF4400 domain-containing protein [Diaphorobacter sp. HDW4A]QIL80326.1 DUF4400 domain-containing protein [Diaphorobacter sp. HDW4A]